MKTYIARVELYNGTPRAAVVNEITNQLPGPVSITPGSDAGYWWINCNGAFAQATVCSCLPMGNEPDAGANQYIVAAKVDNDRCVVRFGNGEETQAPNAGPYRIEINVAE